MAPVAEDMRTLTESLLTSAKDRGKAIVDIKSGVAEFVEACDASRESVRGELRSMAEQVRSDAAQVRKQMADGEAARLDAFRETYARVAGRVDDIAVETQGLLGSARAKRRAVAEDLQSMGREVRSGAAQHAKELAESEAARIAGFREMYDRIASRVAQIGVETLDMLATSELGRTRAFQDLKGRIGERMAELTSEVQGIEREAQSMLETFRGELDSVRSDGHEVSKIWSDFTRARAGFPTVERIVAQQAEAPAAAARKPGAEGRPLTQAKAARAAWEEMSDDEKVLKVIRDSPDGVSASEIGHRLDTTAIMAGKIATQLAENPDMPVRKDEGKRLYYPAT